jgi:hypothetical protein
MSSELTNLLPSETLKAFRRSYFLRLGTIALLLLTALAVIHALLMLPSYLYARAEVNAETTQLNRLTNSLATSEEQTAQNELNDLQSEATYLSQLSGKPTASAVIQALLAVQASGISISGFSFAAPIPPATGTMQISGIAATREDLRSYDQALSSLPFVTSANLPISDYASDDNIPFTITLTGTLNPATHS